jgi:hypothetical protein
MAERVQRRPSGSRVPPTTVTALNCLRLWFDERTVASVFEPLVADWQCDVATARSSAKAWRRRLAGGAALILSAVQLAPRACVHDAAGTGRFVAAVLLATILLPVGVLVGPYLAHGPAVVGWLLPPVLAGVLPFALLPLGMRLSRWPVAGDVRRRLAVRWVTLACGLQAILLAGAASSASTGLYATTAVAPAVYAALGWRLGRHIGPIGNWRLAFWWIALAMTSWVLWSARRTLGVPLEAAALLPLCFALLVTTLLGPGNTAHDDGTLSRTAR